jgi:hypothetical protein
LATDHYYRRDYLSALKIMVPLIEGVILQLMGAPITQHVTNTHLINFLKAQSQEPNANPPYSQDPRLQGRFSFFRDLLCDFLDKRFYERVAVAQAQNQFDFSMLNRHYILHQLGQSQFDSLHDCQTMFQLFDLLMETISCQKGYSSSYCFIPETAEVLDRESHYWSVILNDYFKADNRAQITNLLALHSSFTQPSEDTIWVALHGNQLDDKEAIILAEGLTRVSQRTLANIGLCFVVSGLSRCIVSYWTMRKCFF